MEFQVPSTEGMFQYLYGFYKLAHQMLRGEFLPLIVSYKTFSIYLNHGMSFSH